MQCFCHYNRPGIMQLREKLSCCRKKISLTIIMYNILMHSCSQIHLSTTKKGNWTENKHVSAHCLWEREKKRSCWNAPRHTPVDDVSVMSVTSLSSGLSLVCLSLGGQWLSWAPHPRVNSCTGRSITTHAHTHTPSPNSYSPPPFHWHVEVPSGTCLGSTWWSSWVELNYNRLTAYPTAPNKPAYIVGFFYY